MTQRALVAGATLGASAVFASSAQASGNTYTVTTNGDDSSPAACSGNTCTTLRDAIKAVNTDGGGDTITFSSSLANQTITLQYGELEITSPGNTIDGSNASGLAVSGEGSSRVFYNDVSSGTTTIENLTVENGYGDGIGGAILNYYSGSSLVLNNVTIQNSQASYSHGQSGGGVYSDGPLTITNSHITGNLASEGGGVAGYGGTSVTNSTISGNFARYGGGIESDGSLSVSGSQITGNRLPSADTGGFGEGGGIRASVGPVSVTNTTVSNNQSGDAGGIFSGTSSGATISNSTVSGNTATYYGGGVLLDGYDTFTEPDIHNSVIARIRARQAALAKRFPGRRLPQVASGTGGPISVSDSTISGNSAFRGGGVAVPFDGSNNPITVSASTVSGNTAKASASESSFGGGILLGTLEDPTFYSPVTLVDSTVSGNTADKGGGVSVGIDKGAPLLGSGGSFNFNNSTIASNAANLSGGGGGIYLAGYGSNPQKSATAGIFSTIVARDTAAGAADDLDQSSGSTTGGFNASYSLLESIHATLLSSQWNLSNTDPQLGALANNGGPTQTMLPAFTSPVIDAGKNSGLSSDQRGDPRTVSNAKPQPPGGDGTDIGAVEVQKIPILAIIAPATSITSWAATLNGKIDTNSEAVKWHFQYGTTTGYGSVTPTESISAGHGQVPVSFTVSGLYPDTLYHYRLVAVAANGASSTSADATFTTLSPTINDNPHRVYGGNVTRVFGFAGGCPAGDRVTLISKAFSDQHTFLGRNAIYAHVKSGGYYSVLTTIPKGRTPGRYAITGRCNGHGFAATAYLRVLAKAAVKPVIAFTG